MRPLPLPDPEFGNASAADLIDTVIVPTAKDLGGFTVGRVLPAVERRMVGPFILLDQAGPAEILISEKFDVRPHPHIGLATVTYIHEGKIVHRDSMGSEQTIQPGDVNWMTAGRGIAHSERAPAEFRGERHRLYGFQTWVALPKEREETSPTFAHHPKDAFRSSAATARWSACGRFALWRTLAGRDVRRHVLRRRDACETGARLPIDAGHEERAVYVVDGTIEIAGDRFDATRLVVFRPGDSLVIRR